MPAAQTQEPTPTVAEVDLPIINSPFREPERHWLIERGKPPVKAEGRRRASYFYRVPEHAGRGKKNKKQAELFADAKGQEVELEIVNLIRERVKEWRDGSRSGGVAYDGATPITKELLELWRSSDRMQRLFFAQIEAAETIIFLTEAADIYRKGIPEIPKDEPGLESKAAGVRVLSPLCLQDGDRLRQDDCAGDAGRLVHSQQRDRTTRRPVLRYDPDRLPQRHHPRAVAGIGPGAGRS